MNSGHKPEQHIGKIDYHTLINADTAAEQMIVQILRSQIRGGDFLISRLWFQNFAFTCFSRPASDGKAASRIVREYADSTKIGYAVALSSFLVAKIKMSAAKENGGRKHKIQFAG